MEKERKKSGGNSILHLIHVAKYVSPPRRTSKGNQIYGKTKISGFHPCPHSRNQYSIWVFWKQKEGTPAKDKSTFFIPHPRGGMGRNGGVGSKCRSLRGGSVQLAPKRPQSNLCFCEDKRDGLVTQEDRSSSGDGYAIPEESSPGERFVGLLRGDAT
ncbi:hypothetical protein RUM43_009941 [Polyplax serrata]|uniref:Uncharacterized protein n=1 Tax=Polyplax serrata TaxID=468196 RepID=A0AAN8S005_POLSC